MRDELLYLMVMVAILLCFMIEWHGLILSEEFANTKNQKGLRVLKHLDTDLSKLHMETCDHVSNPIAAVLGGNAVISSLKDMRVPVTLTKEEGSKGGKDWQKEKGKFSEKDIGKKVSDRIEMVSNPYYKHKYN